MDKKEVMNKYAESVKNLLAPINFPQLLKSGVLEKIGGSYYVKNMRKLPKNVSARITSVSVTKHGSRVTFLKSVKLSAQ